MRRPPLDVKLCKERRELLAKRMPGAVLVLPAHPEMIRNHDADHPYRQDSNLFYLTGFTEPESILVFRPGQNPETILFVRPKDRERETWTGFRYGPELTQQEFQIDKTYLVSDFDREIVGLLSSADKLYYHFGVDKSFDQRMLDVLERARVAKGRTGLGALPVLDSWSLIGELRIRKSAFEVEMMRKAGAASAAAHIEAMRFTKPGVSEKQLEGVLVASFMLAGCERVAYNPIVATGNNATCLHYHFNDQPCKDGDLLLIDAAGEYNYYAADITRTWPVNGRFTPVQKRVYDAVLDVQKAVVDMVKPGVAIKTLQDYTIERLTEFMLEFKLLSGEKRQLIETLAYKRFYPHGIGHLLGMDVHDTGAYVAGKDPRPLEAGFVLTVEPGLYIPEDDMTVPAEYRGIGIRIEDDILVTENGNENLTSAVPKEAGEMEGIIGQNSHFH